MDVRTLFLAPLLCVALAAAAFALPDLSLRSLSADERAVLESRRPLILTPASVKEVRLTGTGAAAELLELFRAASPNFLAEAVFVLPVPRGSEAAVMAEARSFLSDVRAFDGIPYYSRQNKTWNPLFEETVILQETRSGGGFDILVNSRMRPFEPGRMRYLCAEYPAEGRLLFQGINLDPLVFSRYNAVAPARMRTALLIERREGALVFYGLGGARAFSFFGLFGERLDTAFLGRIEAFYAWFHKEFVLPRTEPGAS